MFGPDPDEVAYHLGCLQSPLQVARIRPDELPAGQPDAQDPGLTAALFGKRRIELALDAVIPVPRRLTVPDEDQTSGSGASWQWGGVATLWLRHNPRGFGDASLRRLRARSDLDAYTNFLLVLDRTGPIFRR